MGPELMEDLVEEVLVRFPPDDPARLVHAALVCKRWCRLISGAGFRRRFCQFHGRAPMLGFFANSFTSSEFVSTSSVTFRDIRGDNFFAMDVRHGRVLFCSGPAVFTKWPCANAFIVWDAMTGKRRKLPLLPRAYSDRCYNSWKAAVLCAATPSGTCDHLNCHCGPFFVVFVGITDREISVRTYSSEAGSWSETTYTQQHDISFSSLPLPCALVGNSLYFVLRLKYDLGIQEMSTIDLPPDCFNERVVLTGTEDGRLGFASVENFKLYLWYRKAGPDAMGAENNSCRSCPTVSTLGCWLCGRH